MYWLSVIVCWFVVLIANSRCDTAVYLRLRLKLRCYATTHKIIDSENFIKVSQNPNKVARDTQGLPTVPHNDFGGLNFKGLASNYLLLMATSPYKVTFSKKKSWKNLLESEKTSDSALSGVVRIEIWSSFLFCVSSFWATARHVNGPACGICREGGGSFCLFWEGEGKY